MSTFKLPDLGEGLKEAEIVSWHVAIGDHVVADQPLVSVETAKAVVEVPSPWSGRLAAIHGSPGSLVQVGAPLADIEIGSGSDNAADDDAATVVGSLPRGEGRQATRPVGPEATATGGRVKASPTVRALAARRGVSLASLAGSGPEGLVTVADVEQAARTQSVSNGFEAMRGVRRAMAEAVGRSANQVVATTVTDEAIVDAWRGDTDPTIRLVRAIAAGCRSSPSLNAWLDDKTMGRRLHTNIDLALAMETEDGLFAPVLRDVGARDDQDLRRGLDALKRDVVRRAVPPRELRDPTITLSNFGMLGGLHAALTIVPPQVAILGAGRLHMSPRVVAQEIRATRVMPLSLTFDHRAATGAEAIRFLNAVISDLEKP